MNLTAASGSNVSFGNNDSTFNALTVSGGMQKIEKKNALASRETWPLN